MFQHLIPFMVQAAVNAVNQQQERRLQSPQANTQRANTQQGAIQGFFGSPLGMALLGLALGRVFPNAFAPPGSGYERAMLNAMLNQLSQTSSLNRAALSSLARIPPVPSVLGALESRASAQAERAAERALAQLPPGVQLPGLRERMRSAAYSALAPDMAQVLQAEQRIPFEDALRRLQMLQSIGGQAADLAQGYGYLAQLYGQRGNLFVGALPQLLEGLWLWGLSKKQR